MADPDRQVPKVSILMSFLQMSMRPAGRGTAWCLGNSKIGKRTGFVNYIEVLKWCGWFAAGHGGGVGPEP